MQALCLVCAVGILLAAPPIAAGFGWLLTGVFVPILWASFFVGQKRRHLRGQPLDADLWQKSYKALLLVGLVVAAVSAFTFATELAK